MSEWKTVRLGDVCEILDSKRVPITAHERKNGSYPYYGANGIQDYVADYIFDDELVLLAEDGGNFGSKEKPIAYRVSGKCWVNNHAHVLKPKECLDVDYLCDSIKFYDVSTIVNGATRQKLTQSAMVEMKIFLPPLETQKQIAKQLNKCTTLLAKHKQMLETYDTLIKSRFIEMFGDSVQNPMGWEVKKLGKMCSAIMNGTTPKGGEQVYVENGITFLRSQNVWRNKIDLDDVAYIDEATHKSMKKSSLKKYDILMTKTGRINTENSSLGRAALFLGEDDSANINGHVYLIRLEKEYNHEFVIRILTSPEYRDYIRSICVGGIDKRQVNKDHIEEFPIIQPPKELQDEYSTFVHQIDKSKFEIWLTLQNYGIIEKRVF